MCNTDIITSIITSLPDDIIRWCQFTTQVRPYKILNYYPRFPKNSQGGTLFDQDTVPGAHFKILGKGSLDCASAIA